MRLLSLIFRAAPVLLAVQLQAWGSVDCGPVTEWERLKNTNVATLKTRGEVSELLVVQEPAARRDSAEWIWRSYMAGKIQPGFLQNCISTDFNREYFLRRLAPSFFSKTLEKIRTTDSPEFIQFLKLLNEQQIGDFALFEVTANFREDPSGLKAGFHRGKQSLFMNFEKVSSSEWFFIFTHELAHRLDPILAESVRIYSQKERFEQVIAISKKLPIREKWSREEIDNLRNLLLAGLDRGFLGEYRAWTLAFQLYEPGITAGLWNRIGWVDDILAERKSGESLPAFVFRFLDSRFPDTSEGFYRIPAVQDELAKIRSELRASPRPPRLITD